MAGARKLQAEIDRCLKKVSEGVEKFEETWKKVHNASNSNQKEKYEEDLKKEIKKLQRLRDQIKTWLASGEIKDKSTLMENRKLIETQMERFKIVERETKTKAYSKEGLTNSTRLDPAEREKHGVQQWMNQCIDQLNIQMDQFEAEIESLSGGGKKKKGKNADAERVEECQMWVDKHQDHIKKLETLLRMLDNDQVSVQQIKDIQEEIDNYIENCQEPDFIENEYIYDDIDGLDEMLRDVSHKSFNSEEKELGAPEHNSVEASETASCSTNSVSGSSPIPGQTASSNHNSVPSVHQDDLKRRHRSSQSDDSKSAKKSGNNGTGMASSSSGPCPASPLPVRPVSSTPTKSTGPPQYSLSQSPNNSSPSSGVTLMAGLTNHLQTSDRQQNFAAAAAATLNGHQSSESGKETGGSPPSSPTHFSSSNHVQAPSFPKLLVETKFDSVSGSSGSGLPAPGSYPHPGGAGQPQGQPQVNGGSVQPAPGLSQQNTLQEQLQQQKNLPESLSSLKSLAQQALGQTNPPPAGYLELGLTQERHKLQHKNEAHIPPLLGVAPLGIVPLSKEHQFQYSMLEAASHHLPHPSDSERLRPYLPRNPCHTPPYYPQAPPPGSDTIDFFQKLSTETLFFIFYYMEGTKAQYLAAKALKKQSWRFHTKYMMWFQRHEEPKMINDEYEQGTYIYFDYEKWGQRKKEGFLFEYRFLEDRDLN